MADTLDRQVALELLKTYAAKDLAKYLEFYEGQPITKAADYTERRIVLRDCLDDLAREDVA